MEWHISSLSDLEQAIPDIAKAIGPRRKVALYGEMGAGKTTFVQAFCRWLGTTERPDSPTFSLINEYTYRDAYGQTAKVNHLDLYRLRNAEEAFDLGFGELLSEPGYCFIEWPQLVEPFLPADTAKLHFRVVSAYERHLILS